jgi:hypothetical protein
MTYTNHKIKNKNTFIIDGDATSASGVTGNGLSAVKEESLGRLSDNNNNNHSDKKQYKF